MMQVWQDVYTTGGQNQILLTRASGDMGSWNLPSRPEVRKGERGSLGWGVLRRTC